MNNQYNTCYYTIGHTLVVFDSGSFSYRNIIENVLS